MIAIQDNPDNRNRDDPLSARGSEVNRSRLGHIPALDGVRGVAILLVLINHFSPEGDYDNRLAKFFQPITGKMTIGVDLFFVLSGYLITGILLRSRTSQRYFRNFYLRRALRIFPLYYFVLILLAVGLATIPSWKNLDSLRHAWPWYWFYGTNYLICHSGFSALDHKQVSLGHFWSLAVEEHFYLFWPMIVWLCSDRRLVRVCIALIVIAPLCRAYAVVSGQSLLVPLVATQCRMDTLALGALLAVVLQSTTPADLLRRFRFFALLSAALAVVCLCLESRIVHLHGHAIHLSRPMAIIKYSFVAFAWAAFILLALNSAGLTSRIMSQRWLRFFGVYSYGMYIYHRLILNALTTEFSMRRLSYHGKLWTGILPHYALCLGATALIALASYHLYEKHFLKLKRLFE
ncbi:MAG: acyltransferase [Tepidisphaeraceae bacterium]|jgi:peptidoglycan/LPS O-acetylase OafA/YrhL